MNQQQTDSSKTAQKHSISPFSHGLLIAVVWLSLLVCHAMAAPVITLSSDRVDFQVTEHAGEYVQGNQLIRVYATSSTTDWSVNYQLLGPLQGSDGAQILPENIEIETLYTAGYQPANTPHLTARGDVIDPPAQDVGNLSLRLRWAGLSAGRYSGQLVSPDGGPTINLGVDISESAAQATTSTVLPAQLHFPAAGGPAEYPADTVLTVTLPLGAPRTLTLRYTPLMLNNHAISGGLLVNNTLLAGNQSLSLLLPPDNVLRLVLPIGWLDPAGHYLGSLGITDVLGTRHEIALSALITAHTVMSLSNDNIVFNATQPGKHRANRHIALSVGSSAAKWTVTASATDLRPAIDGSVIPRGQLNIRAIAEGENSSTVSSNFFSLYKSRTILKGNSRPLGVAGDLTFRLTTTLANQAGTYKGRITFTCLECP